MVRVSDRSDDMVSAALCSDGHCLADEWWNETSHVRPHRDSQTTREDDRRRREKREKGGQTFVAPDLFYPLPRVRVELPDDVGKVILCVVEERLEVVVPCGGGVGDRVFEAG